MRFVLRNKVTAPNEPLDTQLPQTQKFTQFKHVAKITVHFTLPERRNS